MISLWISERKDASPSIKSGTAVKIVSLETLITAFFLYDDYVFVEQEAKGTICFHAIKTNTVWLEES
jgi:Na+-translocating ferredoxin:NAD+ oxidoreductase RnfD subunit